MEAKAEPHLEHARCPACGGAGGGPFGRAGSAWDNEDYECARCEGVGFVLMDHVIVESLRPGLAKALPDGAQAAGEGGAAHASTRKRKASA